MFWVTLSGAEAFEWGCDLNLSAETMTCDVMPTAQTMKYELGGLRSFPTEKGNASEALKKTRVYRCFLHSLCGNQH
jgi:hypothetical protein